MNIPNTLDLIPTDLLHEVFSRLPAKSVGRCRCVSKTLASILGSEDFKQLFLKRSLTRPRFLFAFITNNHQWVFYSSCQPQNEKPSLVLKTECPRLRVRNFAYAHGLFYSPNTCISTTKGEEDKLHVICNPSTGQYVILPNLETDIWHTPFLGFDPINKQFKILVMNVRENNDWVGFILTLGTGSMRWRKIKCPFLRDYPFFFNKGICIDGVLYCLAKGAGVRSSSHVIVCFDVRTETFKFKPIVIDLQGIITRGLINYNGRLGITILSSGDGNTVELYMLVLKEENDEKKEWSKYTFPSTINFNHGSSVVGMNSSGEIVLSTIFKQVNLYYFDLEKNSLQSVEVQGLENACAFRVIMDHVEDLHINDAKYFKSNIHHANMREANRSKFESINPFEALSLSDEEYDDE